VKAIALVPSARYGSSSLTWQALAGVGYSFKWGDALGDKPVQSLLLSGPAFGASFVF
jgi:hypothetical protein